MGYSSVADGGYAHVDYVVDWEGAAGNFVRFVVDVLSDPINAALVGAAGVAVVAAAVGYAYVHPAARDVAALRTALAEYEPYVPWMLRLSLGLPLVGAGFAGYFFSPSVAAPTRSFQVVVGFLLLFGLATRVVAAVGLLAYLVGVAARPELLLASEYVGGFVAVALVGSGRPSADHLLQRVAAADGTVYGRFDPVHRLAARFDSVVDPYERFAPTAVRLALGFNFMYLGVVEKLFQPRRALAVVEKYDLTAVVPVDPGMWVLGAGLTELAIGAALFVGLYTRGVAAAAFVVLTTTLFGLPDDPVLAHVTLFGLSSALFVTGSGPVSVDRLLGVTAPAAPDAEPAG